jgi:branched-subunit amino acid transport protein
VSVWIAIVVTAVGCYLLKYAGLAAPRRLLDHPAVRRFAMTVPVALLAALIALQAVAPDGPVELDGARLAGMGAAVAALVLRAPFLVVVVAAAGTTALLRAAGLG